MTKKNLLFFILLISISIARAQFYKNVLPAHDLSESFSKVVLDFRNDFRNIQGTAIPKEVGIDMYESTIKLSGSVEDYITRSHSVKDPAASFQAIMYKGEDYEKAKKIYANTYKTLKKTRVRWVDKSLNNFIGKYEPAEGLNFTVSYLKVEIQDERYKDFVTEVELLNSGYAEWVVQVNVVKKKLDIEIIPDN